MQLLETLIELVQGSVKNQEAIFNALVIEDINFMLRSAKYRKAPAFKVESICIDCGLQCYHSVW